MMTSTTALIARYAWDASLALTSDDVLVLEARELEPRPLFDVDGMDVEMRRAPAERMVVTLSSEHRFPPRSTRVEK